MQFIIGVFNGSSLLTTQNLTQCRAIIDKHVVQNGLYIVNRTKEGDIYVALTTVFDITYHLYDINTHCYYGVLDGVDTLIKVRNAYTNPRNLIDNLVYNFGHIFDALRDGINWLKYG